MRALSRADFGTCCVVVLGMAAFLLFASPQRAVAQILSDEDVRTLEKTSSEGITTARKEGGKTGPLRLFLRMLTALALVLALILLAAYAFRRFGRRTEEAGRRSDIIRVVGTKMLGGRRSLMLVRVRGQTLLLGLTPQSIHCLTEIHEVEGEWAQPAEEEGRVSSAFDRKLGKFIDQTISDPVSKPS